MGVNGVFRTLVQEDYPAENLAFLESAGIKFFQFPIPGNKEPFVVIPDTSVIGALETILDKRNHPILVHCNAGKVRPPPLKRAFPRSIPRCFRRLFCPGLTL